MGILVFVSASTLFMTDETVSMLIMLKFDCVDTLFTAFLVVNGFLFLI